MVIRMRHTRAHTGNRRSHHALKNPSITADKDGAVHLRHRASATTGKYKGISVINLDKKIARKEKKAKAATAAR
ncbi:MAG: 50S ribosomal protein L32 [Candidatus Paceibacterota bacterium]